MAIPSVTGHGGLGNLPHMMPDATKGIDLSPDSMHNDMLQVFHEALRFEHGDNAFSNVFVGGALQNMLFGEKDPVLRFKDFMHRLPAVLFVLEFRQSCDSLHARPLGLAVNHFVFLDAKHITEFLGTVRMSFTDMSQRRRLNVSGAPKGRSVTLKKTMTTDTRVVGFDIETSILKKFIGTQDKIQDMLGEVGQAIKLKGVGVDTASKKEMEKARGAFDMGVKEFTRRFFDDVSKAVKHTFSCMEESMQKGRIDSALTFLINTNRSLAEARALDKESSKFSGVVYNYTGPEAGGWDSQRHEGVRGISGPSSTGAMQRASRMEHNPKHTTIQYLPGTDPTWGDLSARQMPTKGETMRLLTSILEEFCDTTFGFNKDLPFYFSMFHKQVDGRCTALITRKKPYVEDMVGEEVQRCRPIMGVFAANKTLVDEVHAALTKRVEIGSGLTSGYAHRSRVSLDYSPRWLWAPESDVRDGRSTHVGPLNDQILRPNDGTPNHLSDQDKTRNYHVQFMNASDMQRISNPIANSDVTVEICKDSMMMGGVTTAGTDTLDARARKARQRYAAGDEEALRFHSQAAMEATSVRLWESSSGEVYLADMLDDVYAAESRNPMLNIMELQYMALVGLQRTHNVKNYASVAIHRGQRTHFGCRSGGGGSDTPGKMAGHSGVAVGAVGGYGDPYGGLFSFSDNPANVAVVMTDLGTSYVRLSMRDCVDGFAGEVVHDVETYQEEISRCVKSTQTMAHTTWNSYNWALYLRELASCSDSIDRITKVTMPEATSIYMRMGKDRIFKGQGPFALNPLFVETEELTSAMAQRHMACEVHPYVDFTLTFPTGANNLLTQAMQKGGYTQDPDGPPIRAEHQVPMDVHTRIRTCAFEIPFCMVGAERHLSRGRGIMASISTDCQKYVHALQTADARSADQWRLLKTPDDNETLDDEAKIKKMKTARLDEALTEAMLARKRGEAVGSIIRSFFKTMLLNADLARPGRGAADQDEGVLSEEQLRKTELDKMSFLFLRNYADIPLDIIAENQNPLELFTDENEAASLNDADQQYRYGVYYGFAGSNDRTEMINALFGDVRATDKNMHIKVNRYVRVVVNFLSQIAQGVKHHIRPERNDVDPDSTEGVLLAKTAAFSHCVTSTGFPTLQRLMMGLSGLTVVSEAGVVHRMTLGKHLPFTIMPVVNVVAIRTAAYQTEDMLGVKRDGLMMVTSGAETATDMPTGKETVASFSYTAQMSYKNNSVNNAAVLYTAALAKDRITSAFNAQVQGASVGGLSLRSTDGRRHLAGFSQSGQFNIRMRTGGVGGTMNPAPRTLEDQTRHTTMDLDYGDYFADDQGQGGAGGLGGIGQDRTDWCPYGLTSSWKCIVCPAAFGAEMFTGKIKGANPRGRSTLHAGIVSGKMRSADEYNHHVFRQMHSPCTKDFASTPVETGSSSGIYTFNPWATGPFSLGHAMWSTEGSSCGVVLPDMLRPYQDTTSTTNGGVAACMQVREEIGHFFRPAGIYDTEAYGNLAIDRGSWLPLNNGTGVPQWDKAAIVTDTETADSAGIMNRDEYRRASATFGTAFVLPFGSDQPALTKALQSLHDPSTQGSDGVSTRDINWFTDKDMQGVAVDHDGYSYACVSGLDPLGTLASRNKKAHLLA